MLYHILLHTIVGKVYAKKNAERKLKLAPTNGPNVTQLLPCMIARNSYHA